MDDLLRCSAITLIIVSKIKEMQTYMYEATQYCIVGMLMCMGTLGICIYCVHWDCNSSYHNYYDKLKLVDTGSVALEHHTVFGDTVANDV